MKRIIISQEHSEPLELLDDDSNDLESYSKIVSEVLESTKVCILQTSTQILILKPSKINSILVSEVEDKKGSKVVIVKPKIEITEKQEDVIKD